MKTYGELFNTIEWISNKLFELEQNLEKFETEEYDLIKETLTSAYKILNITRYSKYSDFNYYDKEIGENIDIEEDTLPF